MRIRLETAFVALVFVALLAGAIAYVATYGSRVLVLDDLTLAEARTWGWKGLPERLWSFHNEHRIPLPRAVLWSVASIVGDPRANSYVIVALLAGASAGAVWAARRIRGHTSASDAFFPLLWLHTGNCENLLMGFQVSLVLPTALVCVVVFVSIVRGFAFTRRDALVCSAALVSLPLCGGPGMLQAPTLACWLALVGFVSLRSREPVARGNGRILFAAVALTALLGVLYVVGYRQPPEHGRTFDIEAILGVAARVITMSLGQAAAPWWPWSFAFVAALTILGTHAAIRAWPRERTPEFVRGRGAAVLFAVATTSLLAVGIGIARGTAGTTPGFAVRYIGLASPLLCTAYLACVAFARPRVTAVATYAALLVSAAALLHNVPRGDEYGRARVEATRAFEEDVFAGRSCFVLIRRHGAFLDPEAPRLATMMQHMVTFDMHPFDRYPPSARETIEWPMFESAPRSVEGSIPPAARRVGEEVALVVSGGSGVTFAVPGGTHRITGTFGALEGAWKRGRYVRARFEIVAHGDDDAATTLYSRVLEAGTNEADRGPQPFAVEFDPTTTRYVALRVEAVDPAAGGTAWLWMRGAEFE